MGVVLSLSRTCGLRCALLVCVYNQWRRSVVKSEGSGSLRSSHQTKNRPKFVFVFGAANRPFGHFRFFRFSPKTNFLLRFIFRFRPKNVICVWPKMLCSQLNHIEVLWYRHRVTFVFVFRQRKEFHFCRHFHLRPKMKKCIFGRPLHQTNYFRLHPTSMIFKHSTTPGSGQPVGTSKN